MVLQNGSPKATYKEIWDKDRVARGQLDLSNLNDKNLISMDGRAAGSHQGGLGGAVGEVLTNLDSLKIPTTHVSPERPYQLGDAQKYANKLRQQVSKQRLQSNYRMSLATRPMFKDLDARESMKVGIPY